MYVSICASDPVPHDVCLGRMPPVCVERLCRLCAPTWMPQGMLTNMDIFSCDVSGWDVSSATNMNKVFDNSLIADRSNSDFDCLRHKIREAWREHNTRFLPNSQHSWIDKENKC